MTLVAMSANMKSIIILLATLSAVQGEPAPAPVAASASTTATESTSKADAKSANSIPVQQQKATFYTPMLHRPPYIQYVQRPMLLPQPQATMLIIAQPAVMPQQMIYSQAAQQLLNYFHSNPQARYQFLHGNFQPHPTVQTYLPQYNTPQYTQSYQTSPSLGNYQIVPAPHQYSAPTNQHTTHTHTAQAYSAYPAQPTQAAYSAQPTQLAYSSQNQIPVSFTQHQQPTSLSQLANLGSQYQSPIKTAPPIITGFENFTPEQQAQIKQQLSSHFGGELSQISGNSVQAQTKYNFDAAQATSAEDSKESPTEFTYRNMFSKG